MPQIPYRANLSAAIYPMTLADAGRTVVVPQADQNFDRRVDPEGEQKDAGIPQAIYMENVLPTPNGYQSVGYIQAEDISGAVNQIIEQVWVGGSTPGSINRATISWVNGGPMYIAVDGLDNWTVVTWVGLSSFPIGDYKVTSAVVNGIAYILFSWTSQRLYTASGTTFTDVTATVLPGGFAVDLRSIAGSYGYLLATKRNNPNVYWSSLLNPVDFTASLITGAGNAAPSNAYSTLESIDTNATGFFIYTGIGVIQAFYTGNTRYPWRFLDVKGASTIIAAAFGDTDASFHPAIDANGTIKLLTPQEATMVAPEVSKYLASAVNFDMFNSTTNVFSRLTRFDGLNQYTVNIYFAFNRYILISCDYYFDGSASYYKSIIIFDTLLKRYGRLKIDHTNIVYTTRTYKAIEAIGIINGATLDCFTLSFATFTVDGVLSGHTALAHAGVLLIGKLQYIRNRLLQLENIEIESVNPSTPTDTSVVFFPSLDGKNFDAAVIPYFDAAKSSDYLKVYKAHNTAKNHSIMIKGKFDLNTLECVFALGGDK